MRARQTSGRAGHPQVEPIRFMNARRPSVQAKICGLSTPDAVEAAIGGGAAYVGFVFFARSPRNVTPDAAARLARPARAAGVGIVAVTVDADDALLGQIGRALAPDYVQLHGAETPARVGEVRRLSGAGAIKALRVAGAEDLARAEAYLDAADMLMFDAQPPAGARLPGGNGAAFDWTLLAGARFARPWLLAGGLAPGNVAQAVRASGAALVDVSSGVEREPGCKDARLITAFLDAVRCV